MLKVIKLDRTLSPDVIASPEFNLQVALLDQTNDAVIMRDTDDHIVTPGNHYSMLVGKNLEHVAAILRQTVGPAFSDEGRAGRQTAGETISSTHREGPTAVHRIQRDWLFRYLKGQNRRVSLQS
jgi:hypothetical protein